MGWRPSPLPPATAPEAANPPQGLREALRALVRALARAAAVEEHLRSETQTAADRDRG
jgi:hypothetical protein